MNRRNEITKFVNQHRSDEIFDALIFVAKVIHGKILEHDCILFPGFDDYESIFDEILRDKVMKRELFMKLKQLRGVSNENIRYYSHGYEAWRFARDVHDLSKSRYVIDEMINAALEFGRLANMLDGDPNDTTDSGYAIVMNIMDERINGRT